MILNTNKVAFSSKGQDFPPINVLLFDPKNSTELNENIAFIFHSDA
jgi:hypothetical protein